MILRRQVKRPAYRMRDRALLAAASPILARDRWSVFLVRPETIMGWHRRLAAHKWTRPRRRPGRPALEPEVRRLILRMAKENPRWGYMRIKGELQKLGIRVSATAIATLLRSHGIGPAPRRGPTRSQFLKAQASGLRHHRLRLLHGRDGIPEDALRALLHRDRQPARTHQRLDEQSGLCLRHSAGAKPRHVPFRRGREHQVPHPRPRRQVLPLL